MQHNNLAARDRTPKSRLLCFTLLTRGQLGEPVIADSVDKRVFYAAEQDANPNKSFDGGRPSSIIIGKQLTPEALGSLLVHFENKVMFQGFCWNLNSFDQEGVQLGKVLAKRVPAHETDGTLKAYNDLLAILRITHKSMGLSLFETAPLFEITTGFEPVDDGFAAAPRFASQNAEIRRRRQGFSDRKRFGSDRGIRRRTFSPLVKTGRGFSFRALAIIRGISFSGKW